MAKTCSVCSHPEVEEINRMLVAGVTYREISGMYGLSKSAIDRHKSLHIKYKLSKSDYDIGESIRCNIIDIDETIKDQLKKALESNDLHAVHMFTGDALRLIEIKAKISGRIQTSAQVNVANQLNIYDSPLWLGVGRVLAEILAPYPDLRAKVATALIELEEAHV